MHDPHTEANMALSDLGDLEDADFQFDPTDGLGAIEIPTLPVLNLSGLIPTGEFARTFRFGMIDNSALVLAALFGLSLEDYIAEKVGVPGYGVLIGATVGNAVSDGLAGIPEGRDAALGYFTGAMLPVLPLAIAVGMKKPATGGTATVLKLVSGVLLAVAFLKKNNRKA